MWDNCEIQNFKIYIYKIGEEKMSKTGEKPGVGTYICVACGERVRLDDNTDRLPPCPTCHKTDYRP